MAIRIEFFGIARQRAGVGEILLPSSAPATLSSVLVRVVKEVPELEDLLPSGRLHSTLAANLDGNRFITDPSTLIHDGQSLLLLSADAGG